MQSLALPHCFALPVILEQFPSYTSSVQEPSSFNFVSKILILGFLASYRGLAGTSAACSVVNAALRLIAVKLLDSQTPVASKKNLPGTVMK